MVIAIILGLIAVWSLVSFVDSIVKDYRKPKTKGYRYSDIPSGVNLLELWVIFFITVGFQLDTTLMTVLALAQVVIGVHSLYLNITSRRPYWFDWL